jgi:hypothetical protein
MNVPEYPEGKRNVYAYASMMTIALRDDPTPGGIASRAVLAGKKYTPPKQNGTKGDWMVVSTPTVMFLWDSG